MYLPMLAVDKNLEVVQREQAEWSKRGIPTVRVDTMCEAIGELSRETYLFVSINADNVHYLPMLNVLCEVSPVPVLIITSNYFLCDGVEALHNGADAYIPFQNTVDENIMLALALINKYNRNKYSQEEPYFQSYGKLFIFPHFRQIFCNGEEIPLTKTEYDILLYLYTNRGITLSYGQIYYRIKGCEYQDSAHNALWNHVLRLRKKIARATGSDGYIETVKDVGYRLPVYNGK